MNLRWRANTTVIGLALGVTSIAMAQYLSGGEVAMLLQLTAAVVVVGGTVAAILVQFSWPLLQQSLRMLWWLWYPPQSNRQELADQLLAWSQQVRREGLLVLDRQAEDILDPFARRGIELLVDGVPPDQLEQILQLDNALILSRLQNASKVWEAAGHYAPTIGILGAVLGLIHVMNNLADPDNLGIGIATAFVATIYGVGLANLALLPIARKLVAESRHVAGNNEMLITGLVSIAKGETSHLTMTRLHSFFTHDRPAG